MDDSVIGFGNAHQGKHEGEGKLSRDEEKGTANLAVSPKELDDGGVKTWKGYE